MATEYGAIESGGLGGNCAIGDYIYHKRHFDVEKLAATNVDVYDMLGAIDKVSLRNADGSLTHGIAATVVHDNWIGFTVYCQATAVTQRSMVFHYAADTNY